jgi:hypothetical protein
MRSGAQHIPQRICHVSRLNQFGAMILGRGVLLLRWRRGRLALPRYAALPIWAVTNF